MAALRSQAGGGSDRILNKLRKSIEDGKSESHFKILFFSSFLAQSPIGSIILGSYHFGDVDHEFFLLRCDESVIIELSLILALLSTNF